MKLLNENVSLIDEAYIFHINDDFSYDEDYIFHIKSDLFGIY